MSLSVVPALIFLALFALCAAGLLITRELDKLREAEWLLRNSVDCEDDG